MTARTACPCQTSTAQDVLETIERAGKPLHGSELRGILNADPIDFSYAIAVLVDEGRLLTQPDTFNPRYWLPHMSAPQ